MSFKYVEVEIFGYRTITASAARVSAIDRQKSSLEKPDRQTLSHHHPSDKSTQFLHIHVPVAERVMRQHVPIVFEPCILNPLHHPLRKAARNITVALSAGHCHHEQL